MGLFSDVRVPDCVLPEEARGLEGWQTKDVIDPQMTTLEITPQGELIHEWWEHELVEDPDSFFGFFVRRTVKHRDKLDYHGEMVFYAIREKKPRSVDYDFVECRAIFDDGKLRGVEVLGPYLPFCPEPDGEPTEATP